ncbi:uncharacterized protein IL334_002348 [Kwoniella shivajii]|uniref:Methyltransferase type 11 domain-containing protein n=1 Tax=Kwoniella shivajii TaxID=564305 RepID=A0ABZ1CW64_9TREE|nr:hypothetical protein IL334_002348 [Kwoniella shivajii]
MISPPSPIESFELLYSPDSPTISFGFITNSIPPVPDPRASTFTNTAREPSSYAGSGHKRSFSDNANILRPRPSSFNSSSGAQPSSDMPIPNNNPQTPLQHSFNRPSSPLGSSQFPVGGPHAHGQGSNRYQSMIGVFGGSDAFSASSTPSQTHFPHHHHSTGPTPHSPSYDQAGPSTLRRYASQVNRSHINHRTRPPSGGHERHLRCSPDCTAADAPYHLLSSVIGKASVHDLHRKVLRPMKRKASNDEDVEMEEEPSTARPNIQTRRSLIATSPLLEPPTPSFAFPFPRPLLAFDRKSFQNTPPLPPVDRFKDPPLAGDFFAGAGHDNSLLLSAATSNAIFPHGSEPSMGLDLPRSSSAPSVPLLAQRDRGFSDVSAHSSLSADAFGTAQGSPQFPMDEELHPHQVNPAYLSSPQAIPVSSNQVYGHGLPARSSRFSAFANARKLDAGDRLQSIVGDPTELTSYLGEDLATALKQRLQPEQSEMVKEIKRKEEVLSEAEWSFDVPLSKVIGESVRGWVQGIPDKEHFEIAEYGCHKETPNAVLADTVKSFCQRAVGPGKPKKILTVTHQCNVDFDIRLLQANLTSSHQSYRKMKAIPAPLILTSFSFAGFAESSLPPNSIDLALCSNELSKLHGTIPPRPLYMFTSQAEEREQRAEKDLSSWLKVRAKEVKPGGILACSFAVRTCPIPDHKHHNLGQQQQYIESVLPPKGSPVYYSMSLPTSPRTSLDDSMSKVNTTPMTEINNSPFVPGHPLPSPPMTNGATRRYRPDIWQAMSHALSPAIQRLVSLGEIKTQVAPLLVDVPYWPRTLESIQSTLSKNSSEWEPLINAETGISDSEDMKRSFSGESVLNEHNQEAYSHEEKKEWNQAGIQISRLTHPAWIEFRKGRIDRSAYARRIATYCRSVYEGHLKKVLREKGRMDISQCETTVQEIFKVLVEKCELGVLDGLEIDMGIVVLRRK